MAEPLIKKASFLQAPLVTKPTLSTKLGDFEGFTANRGLPQSPVPKAKILQTGIDQLKEEKQRIKDVSARTTITKKEQPKAVEAAKVTKVSSSDFAERVKSMYPEYKDIDNAQLTERVISLYPEYKDKVDPQSRVSSVASSSGGDGFNTAENKGITPKPSLLEKIGVGFAAAPQAAAEAGQKIEGLIDRALGVDSTKSKEQNKRQEDLLFGKAREVSPESYEIGKKGTKTLINMAATPGLGPIKGVGIFKNALVGGVEGAAATQLNSIIETGKLASLKDTGIGAGMGALTMGTLRGFQKGGSLKQTKDLIIPKQTALEEGIRSDMGLRKKSFFGGAWKPLANKQETEAAKELQTMLRPNKSAQTNAFIMNNAIKKEATAMRKVVEKIPPSKVDPNRIIYDIEKKINAVEVPRSVKSDTTILNKWNNIVAEYVDILEANKNKGFVGILDSRQEIDRIINRDYPNLYTDDANAPLREMVSKLRDTGNDILDAATKGATKESLRKQTMYYTVRDKLKTKLEKTGETNLQRRAKRNPNTARVIRYTAGGTAMVGLGALGGKLGIKSSGGVGQE